jgi:uncharacterized protein with PIN domain
LARSNADLKTKHDNLLQSNKENEADAESRSTHHERLKATVQRLLETKTTYETKLNSKREKITELEAEVKALRAQLGSADAQTAPAATSKKGKGRAENQDENLADPTVFAEAHAAPPRSPVASRLVNPVSEKPKRKRVITIDDEDSLMILEDETHPGGADGQEDSMDFADLDVGLLGAGRRPSRPLTAKKLSSSSSSNTKPSVKAEVGKPSAPATTVSRFFRPTENAAKATQAKQMKLEKSNSEKWADMALGLGGGGKSGNTATGAKKRVKTGF